MSSQLYELLSICGICLYNVGMQNYLPSLSIVGIYAQENGRGMMFEQDDDPPPKPSKTIDEESSSASTSRKTSKPSLRIIK